LLLEIPRQVEGASPHIIHGAVDAGPLIIQDLQDYKGSGADVGFTAFDFVVVLPDEITIIEELFFVIPQDAEHFMAGEA
jgi:hypothetical protein